MDIQPGFENVLDPLHVIPTMSSSARTTDPHDLVQTISVGVDHADEKPLSSQLHWLLLRHARSSEVVIVRDDQQIETGVGQPGHLFLRPAGVSDTWQWVEPEVTVGVGIHPALIRRTLHAAGVRTGCPGMHLARRTFFEDSFLAEMVERLVQEVKVGVSADRPYVFALANAMIFHLLYRYSGTGPDVAQRLNGLTPRKLTRVITYIDENVDKPLLVDEMARLTGLSSFYFCRLFKESTGMTPHSYVLRQRVTRAETLLRDTDISVTNIGSSLGFTSPSHFSWTFRKFNGLTPVAYRRQQLHLYHDQRCQIGI